MIQCAKVCSLTEEKDKWGQPRINPQTTKSKLLVTVLSYVGQICEFVCCSLRDISLKKNIIMGHYCLYRV